MKDTEGAAVVMVAHTVPGVHNIVTTALSTRNIPLLDATIKSVEAWTSISNAEKLILLTMLREVLGAIEDLHMYHGDD